MNRFLRSQHQDAEVAQALMEQGMDPVSQRFVKINHHIPAKDNIELVKGLIRGQVVLGKNHVLAQKGLKYDGIVSRRIVLGKRTGPPRILIVFRIQLHFLNSEHAFFGYL
ncbi:hypothetical protein D1872_273760 [compost metagenome]